jgi:hypothetical protein
MSEPTHDGEPGLTEYEAEQLRRIAAWKAEPTNPFAEVFKRLTRPGARFVEMFLPDEIVRRGLELAYDAAEVFAGRDDVTRQAGVADLSELLHRPLEECDGLAEGVARRSWVIAGVEGAATGAGGVLTTLLDVPLLFVLALRTILKIGHCYGYPLDRTQDRPYVLGVLIVATSGSLATRRERLDELRELEEWLLEETQEDVIAEEAASFLFQLEVFEEIPGVGAVSGALINLAFIHKVTSSARHVFQERWLRDNGKVDVIAPAETHPLALVSGWSGALQRSAYSGIYGLSFGAAFPFWLVASILRPAVDSPAPDAPRRPAPAREPATA